MRRQAPFLFFCLFAACSRERGRTARADPPRPSVEAPPPAPPPPPVHVEEVPVGNDLSAFVVRGREHRMKMLFIPGMCVHPGGYVASFQNTAASRGDLVALQGDVSCGGDGSARQWSPNLRAMDTRIEEAFHVAGIGEVEDVVVIGYSQGAERAERLVARWPEKYRAAILIASPIEPLPHDFKSALAVVTMAGTRDFQGKMRAAVGPLKRANVPSVFLSIPDAQHGQMGSAPEETMAEALDFVEKNFPSHQTVR
jgi:predicted esterase